MAERGQAFIIKAVVTMVILIGLLVLIGVIVDATTGRFGNVGWLYLLLGLAMSVGGVIAAWAGTISFLDRRALYAYRADPDAGFSDGQTVALSGRVRVDGEPLSAPFSGKACACFRYQVNGQSRGANSSGSGYRQQLCLLGFHLLPAILECGAHRFPLMAIADVDADLRSIATGGDWGELGLERIRANAETGSRTDEVEARGRLDEAKRNATAPQSVDLFIASTQTGANQISVTEDIVPVDTVVTVLATYNAAARGLDGRRWGGLKVFMDDFAPRLRALDKEWRKALTIALPLLAVGFALLSVAWWWPV